MKTAPWPALPADSWADTRQTLHLWTQLVGKTRLALAPMLNHWWQVPLYVTSRGLSTGPMPTPGGAAEITFDFQRHKLQLHTSDGRGGVLPLAGGGTLAGFYKDYRALLKKAGIKVKIWPVPVEVEDRTPFPDDHRPRAYDPEAAATFWQVLLRVEAVLQEFRSGFRGKCSPVHFFWGSFDMAVTRFSGRPAPPHPGGIPGLADWVTRESYSSEQCSAGWWPGGNGDEAAFYAYSYPGLPDLADAAIEPAAAYFSTDKGEFLLPYAAIRTAPDPRRPVLAFLESTYAAVAKLADWDEALVG